MSLGTTSASDVWFDLLLPLVLGPLWIALTYSVERAIFAGRPITPFLKSFNLYGALFVVGLVYTMSATALLGFSGQALWISIPAWTLLFVLFAIWRLKRTKTHFE